eukprot:scaffold76191_cov63-Phaeocystis_antarctica.AAC.4
MLDVLVLIPYNTRCITSQRSETRLGCPELTGHTMLLPPRIRTLGTWAESRESIPEPGRVPNRASPCGRVASRSRMLLGLLPGQRDLGGGFAVAHGAARLHVSPPRCEDGRENSLQEFANVGQ